MLLCQNISKHFHAFQALDDLTLCIEPGITAILGPNGAGKSTLLKILTGQITADQGIVSWQGETLDPRAYRLKQQMGVVPDDLGLIDLLSIEEHLFLLGPIYGLSRATTKERSEQLLGLLGLEKTKDTRLGDCSYGMRKKTALAAALLHNPALLVLDEPLEGLDTIASAQALQLLAQCAGAGKTILVTTHQFSVLQSLRARILLLQQGRLAWDSAIADGDETAEAAYFRLMSGANRWELPWLS